MDKSLVEGKGIVLAVPHIGNERFLHIALALMGYTISVVSSKYEDMSKAARDARLDASKGFHHVGFLSDSPRWMIKTLKEGNILQIATTAFGGPKGIKVDVLGAAALGCNRTCQVGYSNRRAGFVDSCNKNRS